MHTIMLLQGPVAQSIASPIADPGVVVTRESMCNETGLPLSLSLLRKKVRLTHCLDMSIAFDWGVKP